MTRGHVVPHGSIPLFARPRSAPPPPSRLREDPSVPLGAPPPDRDLLPVSAELSANVVAFGRTTACPWGVDLYPRGTRATRTRLHVVEKVSRHAVMPHRELLAPADRTLLRRVRPTAPARTAQVLFHPDPGWPDPRAALQHDSTTHHWARHERARDRLRHRAMA
ncbi:MAG TPA: hypothetical protein K8V84_12410, partial [Nocardiopsis listeri]|nr:hypothetical protein [Nocardiopsis listeri]